MGGSRINLLLKVAFPLDLREAIISEESTSSFSDDIILRMLRRGEEESPLHWSEADWEYCAGQSSAGFEGTG